MKQNTVGAAVAPLPRLTVVDRVGQAVAKLRGRAEADRAARRAQYRRLVRAYQGRTPSLVAPQTNTLFTLIAQAHDASRAMTRSTRRDARRRSLRERIRDKIRGVNYYFLGAGLVGIVGMLLTGLLHANRAFLVFTVIWAVATAVYISIEAFVSLLIRFGFDVAELWNPARTWGWTTFDASADDADRKFLRRLALFHRDDIEYIAALVRRRLERARGRIIGARVFIAAIGSALAYFGVRDYLAKYVRGTIPHWPT